MPSLELRVMGEVIYPQGPLTKWSTLICFPSIPKRRQNSRLLSSAPLPSFPLRPVTPCEQWKALNCLFLSGFFWMAPSSPNKSVFEGRRVKVCQANLPVLLFLRRPLVIRAAVCIMQNNTLGWLIDRLQRGEQQV